MIRPQQPASRHINVKRSPHRLISHRVLQGALNHVTFSANQNNFTLYTGLNYAGVINPTVTAANINTSYADVDTNIGGNRTMQMGLKLYF